MNQTKRLTKNAADMLANKYYKKVVFSKLFSEEKRIIYIYLVYYEIFNFSFFIHNLMLCLNLFIDTEYDKKLHKYLWAEDRFCVGGGGGGVEEARWNMISVKLKFSEISTVRKVDLYFWLILVS